MTTPKQLAATNAYYAGLESKKEVTLVPRVIFARTVWLCYRAVSEWERVEYVSLWQVRDMVVAATGLNPQSWNTNLCDLEAYVATGHAGYGLSLEVDVTPKERARRRDKAPAIVRGCPRWIIAMSLRDRPKLPDP